VASPVAAAPRSPAEISSESVQTYAYLFFYGRERASEAGRDGESELASEQGSNRGSKGGSKGGDDEARIKGVKRKRDDSPLNLETEYKDEYSCDWSQVHSLGFDS
jgi:hypothetical protein